MMPVAGNEEKPIGWQSSGYSAGIPIKKRRFPIVRSPSPPPEETQSLHTDNNHSVQKEQSSPSQGHLLSVGIPGSSSPSSHDANMNSASEEINLVANSDRFSEIKIEESRIGSHSRTLADDVDREKKLMSETLINSAKTELKLTPSDDILNGSTELSLGVKGHLNSAVENQESIGAVSLNLSVGKSEKVALSMNNMNRCNWDLNTTMDAWEGPENYTVVGESTISELKTVVDKNDKNPSFMLPGKKILGESECNDPLSNIPFAVPINFQDPLRFSLSSSIYQSNIIGQRLSSSAGIFDANTVTSTTNTRVLVPARSNLDIVSVSSVKSEPHDESVKHVSLGGSTSKSMGLSDFREIKREFILNNSEKVGIAGLENVPKSVKIEHVNEQTDSQALQHMNSGIFSLPTGHSAKLPEPSRGKGILSIVNKNSDDPKLCRSKSTNDIPHESHDNAVSDEEKINLFGDMMEEDPYSSEYYSDDGQVGRREDDFEDGEVRELPVVNHASLVETSTNPIGDDIQLLRLAEEDTKNDLGETSNKESVSVVENEKINIEHKYEQSVFVHVPNSECEEKNLIEEVQTIEVKEIEKISEHTTDGSHGTSIITAEGLDPHINNKIDLNEKNDSGLLLTEASLHETTKDSSGGNRGRIINLSQPSSALSSPSKPRDRSLPSRIITERLPDLPLEGDRLHHRARGEMYNDNSYNLSRERNQHYSSRNPRLNFGRGRGRVPNRMNHSRGGDWNSELDMAPDFYNFPAEPRVTRHNKFESDLEFNGYDDDAFVGTSRRGRKPINNDDAPNFHHFASGRRSPISHSFRRFPRNMGQENTELDGDFLDNNADPAFVRSRPPFDGSSGNFVRGNRNFSSIQRRGPPRIRSKSPIRSRTRSPGRRTSPRRSSDGFVGNSGRRSPQNLYRMRSDRQPCFHGEDVVRRHDSFIDSGWSEPNNHPRFGRNVLRNGRRLNNVDREDGSNDFFPGPGRFNDMVGDGNGEERTRFGGERREGPIRHFRPPYNNIGADGNNFRVNIEDGPSRPFRYGGSEDNTEFRQRGYLLRDNREFDRRLNKNRSGNIHRRAINIGEQEENFRHGGGPQAWDKDVGFADDNISRMKRKRF
ncbi:hypothetical protein ACFE04_029326 [Oxalis oulophora]